MSYDMRHEHQKNNKSGLSISINVLEMVCVIINMAAVIFVCNHNNINLALSLYY